MVPAVSMLMELENVACRNAQPMSRFTSMQVGGPANLLVEPEDMDGLSSLIKILDEEKASYLILGGGTNTIFTDDGYPGVVIHLGEDFRYIRRKGERDLEVGAATPLSILVGRSIELGLMGLEFCHGIPGTTGGAAAGNAGRDGLGIHDGVTKVHGLTRSGDFVTLSRGDYSYKYRFVEGLDIVITSLEVSLEPADPVLQKKLLDKYEAVRTQQPSAQGTSGSIFKNPPDDYAGRLIEAVGLKGRTIGGASVSTWHANWIINNGNASASDVISLITEMRDKVHKKFHVLLEPEVKIIGEGF